MLHTLLFTYHVIRALGVGQGPVALLWEWVRPYHSVHARYDDGSHGPWVDGFRAWRWARTAVADGHVAVRRPLERAFNCFLPVSFPERSAMRLHRRVSPGTRAVTLWGGRNFLAEQLVRSAVAASQREQDDVALELALEALREEDEAMLASHFVTM